MGRYKKVRKEILVVLAQKAKSANQALRYRDSAKFRVCQVLANELSKSPHFCASMRILLGAFRKRGEVYKVTVALAQKKPNFRA